MRFSPHRSELLPWMTEDYEKLVTLHASNKLAHAYLFGGQQGLGKQFLARHFDRVLPEASVDRSFSPDILVVFCLKLL